MLEVLTCPENVSIRNAPIDDEPETEEEAHYRRLQRVVQQPPRHSIRRSRRRSGPDSQVHGICLKRIVLSEQAITKIRALPQPIAMNILTAIHRLAETGGDRNRILSLDPDRLDNGCTSNRYNESRSQ
jgi:hypothetical protein